MVETHQHFRVETTGASMVPFILPGSKLVVEPIDPHRILPLGSILCFLDQDAQGVAHRVIRKTVHPDGVQYWVRGDAQTIEELVPACSAVYRVCRVEHRLLSYDIDGIWGHGFAVVATADSSSMKWLRRLLVKGCLFAIQLRHQGRRPYDMNNR